MALIKCPECEREISNQAQSCPYCGFPITENQNDVVSRASNEETNTTTSDSNNPILENSAKENSEHYSVRANAIIALIFSVTVLLSPIGLIVGVIALIRALSIKKANNLNNLKPIKGFIISIVSIVLALILCVSILLFYVSHTHNFSEWNIIQEVTCDVDGYQERTCNICQKTESETIPATGHAWSSATCTQAKKCRVCGKFKGSALGHTKVDYVCSECGVTLVEEKDVRNIIDISNCYYDVNYVGGIDVYMTVKNKLSKTIKYIYLDVQFYNAVGDILTDEIRLDSTAKLKITGPIKSGETKTDYYWPACFYNKSFDGSIGIEEIKITYTDGTEIVLPQLLAREAIVEWR